MTRKWANPKKKNAGGWVMACDNEGCINASEVFPSQPDLNIFRDRGWFVAENWGDKCPMCLAKESTAGAAEQPQTPGDQ